MSGGPIRRVATVWRRSIQARVVLGTVLLSALVVTVLGWALLRQISHGLVDARVDSSLAEAGRGSADVQTSLSAATTDFDASAKLPDLVTGIVSRGQVQGYDVALIGPLADGTRRPGDGGDERVTSGLSVASVPEALRSVVEQSGASNASWTFTSVAYVDGRPSAPGVVVGTPLVLPADGTRYALYYVFPMTAEQQTVALVSRALLTSAALLLVLVAGIAWLVSRQVVTPVRLARRTAERLSSGRLEERMLVKGDDDIARLAASFNQMASNLQKQIRKLEDMSASQRRFVSDVSHELRTPLTTVRMAGDVLHDARGGFDPVTARAAELLQAELDRFESLLVDLLEISRFDAGAAALHLEDVDLVGLAHRVVGSLEALAERSDTRLVVRADDKSGEEARCVVEADARRVERIVRNLVTNAIDYATSGEVVVLVASNAEGSALAVRDYGVGLKPGEEVRVFNRFWRADASRARTTGGTGLGLSISLEDARLHGGWLQAWGTPGGGAQFRLTLPRHAGEPLTRSALPLVPRDAVSPAVTR